MGGTEEAPSRNLIDGVGKYRWASEGADRLAKLKRHNDSPKQKVADYPTTGPLGSNVATCRI